MEKLFGSFLNLKAPYHKELIAPVLPNKQIASVDAVVRVRKTSIVIRGTKDGSSPFPREYSL